MEDGKFSSDDMRSAKSTNASFCHKVAVISPLQEAFMENVR